MTPIVSRVRAFLWIDLFLVAAGWLGAYAVRFRWLGHPPAIHPLIDYILPLPMIVVVGHACLRACGVYRSEGEGTDRRAWIRAATGSTVAAITVLVLLKGAFPDRYSRAAILLFWGVSVASLMAARVVAPPIGRSWRSLRAAGARATRWSRRGPTIGLLSARVRPRRGLELLVVGLAVALLATDYASVGLRTRFVPCTLDCGETYESFIGAWNLSRFGVRYAAGLQDLAASPESTAHPTLYTHNPNLGMYFMYVLFRFGVDDIHSQARWLVVPFALGLLYLYLFIRVVSRNGLLAALCLVNASALYLLVTLWGFHGVRVFSWVLTFGPAYHLYVYSRRSDRPTWHLAGGMVYLALSFGIDYPFAVFSFFNLLALWLFGLVRLPARSLLTVLGISFGASFVLRQIQVAAVLGGGFWAADFVYSALRRTPLLGALANVPEDTALSSLYSAHNVVRWPDPGTFAPWGWVKLVYGAYVAALGWPFVLLVVAWVPLMLAMFVHAPIIVRRAGRAPVAIGCVILGGIASQAVTFLVFGSYFASFYGSSLMPLLVHWIVPLLGLTTYMLLANARRVMRFGRVGLPMGALLLGVFVSWRAGSEVRNHLLLPPASYPGAEVLSRLKGYSVVTYWVSEPVSVYTRQWSAVLQGERWRTIGRQDLPFTPARDFFAFFEVDKDNPRYGRPDFLFVPAIATSALTERRRDPFSGRIAAVVDGGTVLDGVARRLNWLPLYGYGRDFLLYDLRPVYPSPDGRRGRAVEADRRGRQGKATIDQPGAGAGHGESLCEESMKRRSCARGALSYDAKTTNR